jgi:hypothetical protein
MHKPNIFILLLACCVTILICHVAHGQLYLLAGSDTRYTDVFTGTSSDDGFITNGPVVFGADFGSELSTVGDAGDSCQFTAAAAQFSSIASTQFQGSGAVGCTVQGCAADFADSYLDWEFSVTEKVNYQFQCTSSGSGSVAAFGGFSGISGLPPSIQSGSSGVLYPGVPYYITGSASIGYAPEQGFSASWSFVLTVSPAPVIPRFSQAQKAELTSDAQYFSEVGSIDGQAATTLRGVAAAAAAVGNAPAAAFLTSLSTGVIVGASLNYISKYICLGLALDPPDTNYTVIAQPMPITFTPITASANLTEIGANAWNAWLTNQVEEAAYGQALVTSINRAQGAFNATNLFYEEAQMNAAVQYEAQLAGYLDQEPIFESNMVAQLVTSGFQSVSVTAEDVATNQANVLTNGLDSDLQATLMQLGADGTTITNIQFDFVLQDPNAIAGSFPQSLTNSTADAALHAVASVLRDSSLRLINIQLLPSGQIRFDLPTEPSYIYNIQFNQNLANPDGWTSVLTTNATTSLLSFTNTLIAGQSGFYRASQN